MATSNHAAEVQPHSRGTSEQPASSDGPSELPGLLQLPPDVLGIVIKILCEEQRVVLFQSCRLLARQVVSRVPCVKLSLHKLDPVSCLHMRRSIITQLLGNARAVHVDIRAGSLQPFPHALSDKVRVIRLCSALGDATRSFQWKDLTNHNHINWRGSCSNSELTNLCGAIDQGHLQQLTHFSLCAKTTDSDAQTYKCLAHALGGQLTYLDTNHLALMYLLPQFHKLEAVVLFTYGDASKQLPAVYQSMCKLPGAYVFHVSHAMVYGRALKEVKPGKINRTLRFWKGDMYKEIGVLPLSSFDVIEFCGGLSACDTIDVLVLRDILALHNSKIICTPDSSCKFHLQGADHELLQLLKHAAGVHTLCVDHCLEVPSLHSLWAVLPACVEHVELTCHTGPGWQSMWQGLPATVTKVTFCLCDISTDEMVVVLKCAPKHVAQIEVLVDSGMNNKMRAVSLQHAPPHLTVLVSVVCSDPV